ncbi:hypothetical protein scyTo_0021083 [Scyliorhinus torazame]|uniref:Uncharacterized protein n=1 Tax=Scyliorhinus torazame TaxID=75743 RepID=A0A401PVY3_SCYTO|nr:hypothetical protein [Scyliorhinus torazame]
MVDLTLVEAEDDSVYLNGNSLGLQPKKTKAYIEEELDKWAKIGCYGHFVGAFPWALADECTVELMTDLVGCNAEMRRILNQSFHFSPLPHRGRCSLLCGLTTA